MEFTSSSITLTIAVLGAVLGVLNFWRSVVRDSYRVKVIPKLWLSGDGEGLCIEVINMSNFAITIDDVGFFLMGGDRLVLSECFTRSAKLPERLEPRTAFTIYASPSAYQDSRFSVALKAYAKTSCGKTFKGTSNFFKALIKKRRLT